MREKRAISRDQEIRSEKRENKRETGDEFWSDRIGNAAEVIKRSERAQTHKLRERSERERNFVFEK